MKNIKYLGLLVISLGFFSCEPPDNSIPVIPEEAVEEVALSAPNLDFSRYVSMGASFTAGYTDGALFQAAQINSFPNILANKFKMAGGGDFNQPMMSDNIGGLLFAGNVIQGPRLYFNGSGPVRLSATPTTETTSSVAGALNNFGVPGAKSFHLVAPGYGNMAGVPIGAANPYYARMASGATATVLGDALSQSPSFFTVTEVGGNDVLGYATSGGTGVDQSPTATNPTGNLDPATYGSNDITNPLVFANVFSNMVGALTAGGAKGVVGNIPYVSDLPFFTTIPYNAIPLDAGTAGQLNAGFAAYNNALDYILAVKNANQFPPAIMGLLADFDQAEVNRRKVTYAAGQNAALIMDEDLTDLTLLDPALVNMRPAAADDLLVLTSSGVLGTSVGGNPTLINGVSVPLADQWVLTPEEQNAIKNATDAYNTTIEGVANANPNVALVDLKSVLEEASMGITFDNYTMTSQLVVGGLVSLDGVHLTARGYALMANKILEAMDAEFGSNFTKATNGLAKAGSYPTNYSPLMR